MRRRGAYGAPARWLTATRRADDRPARSSPAEQAAAGAGVRLLLLDTETGSAAEHLYRSTGWLRYGTVPGYAAAPAGALRDGSFFYQQLDG